MMETLLETFGDHVLAALVGLLGGGMLGLAARLGRFCTMGAIEDWLYGQDTRRMRMWLIAIGGAVIGSFGLIGAGLLVPEDTMYLSLRWNPLGSIVGGLMFGYGMALAGNCGYGALARLGGGDLRSFVIVLVMGVFAYMTIAGPIAPLRAALFPSPPVEGSALPGIAHLLGRLSGVQPVILGIGIGAVMLLAGLSRRMLAEPSRIFWSLVVAAAVILGWAGTQWIHDNGFEEVPVVSHTYSRPLGDTLLYLMTSTGSRINFGIGSVAGVVLGAFLGSLLRGHFRWEACEDPRELRRQILGAALMGVGAVTALGCSIGQGLSAFSLLAFSAPVTFLAIIAGAAFGLRQLIEGLRAGAV